MKELEISFFEKRIELSEPIMRYIKHYLRIIWNSSKFIYSVGKSLTVLLNILILTFLVLELLFLSI